MKLAKRTADYLQKLYNDNRASETWGSPEVSRFVFQALRERGFRAGWMELTTRLQNVGQPGLSLTQKILALITGIALVTLANRLMPNEPRRQITRWAKRTFSPRAWKPAVTLYMLGAALLVAENGGGGGGGDWGGSSGGGSWERNPDGSYSLRSDEYSDVEVTNREDEGDGATTPPGQWGEWDETDDPRPGRS